MNYTSFVTVILISRIVIREKHFNSQTKQSRLYCLLWYHSFRWHRAVLSPTMLHVSLRCYGCIVLDTVSTPPLWGCFSVRVHVVPWNHRAIWVVRKTSETEVANEEKPAEKGGMDNCDRRVAHDSTYPDHVGAFLAEHKEPSP